MHTGDLATIDDDGYCNIVGRVKDMLIRGGENIYPREIEEIAAGIPKVQAAQVFGVPDARLGEEVCAWIVLKPRGRRYDRGDPRASARAASRTSRCRGTSASCTSFPLTATGKPQKFVMREQMMRELGVQAVRSA